ncbi:polysaccharide biosynthesis protein [Paenibacillus montanisoli]|uniref:Polysaccharide biosynthesis protein n=1 Tax=Paenibacillus montanisoli TaxID=2081970 RepID=A0A328UBV6_9BACL|nr:nucleoside-diphosphate sugar epimerase/dehydratase [Paenibacillus montanisoli]RAP77476.1 polysaccharide biosynthesis protein [Paenibacillus montanisoli]
MSYRNRIYYFAFVDLIMVWVSLYLAYALHFEGNIPDEYGSQYFIYSGSATIISIACMYLFKQYKQVWLYASVSEMLSVLRTILLSCTLSYLTIQLISDQSIPTYVLINNFETLLFLTIGSRLAWRVAKTFYIRKQHEQKTALIIGAGDCGRLIAKEMQFSRTCSLRPVGFIDDNILKRNLFISGLPVLGSREDIPRVVERFSVDEIIIALPSLSRKETAEIIDVCKSTRAKLKIIPRITDLIHGRVTIQEMREVSVEDLLGRDPVAVDLQGIANYVEGQTVLVTGAGGSIGSELCRQISPFSPKTLLLLGHGENSIYTIEMELRKSFPHLHLETVIADIKDTNRMDEVFRQHRPQVVFHAGAHKHVPLMEKNSAEAVKNNVFGTKNLAECADKYGVDRFVLISSDKAVNPTNVMGTTKRIAEMVIQSLNKNSKTKFAAVRFGNVLGSRGSVIPRFKEQIAQGGPVTVTHPEMVRYFMTIPEAVQLVIQAGALAEGGETFILDMGKPVKIVDLAKDLIRLSGFEPNIDIEITYSGIRPGEKMYEELLTDEEGLTSTKHDRIFIGRSSSMNRTELEFELRRLERVVGEGDSAVREMLKHLVPSYQTSGTVEEPAKSDQRKRELSLVSP